MKRKHRWERPFNLRPPVRAKRRLVTEDQAVTAYELGYRAGQAEESRARDALSRVADAIRTDSVEDLHAELEAEHMIGEIEDYLDGK